MPTRWKKKQQRRRRWTKDESGASQDKLVVLIKKIFSILPCRGTTAWKGALMGFITHNNIIVKLKTNICVIEMH